MVPGVFGCWAKDAAAIMKTETAIMILFMAEIFECKVQQKINSVKPGIE